MTAAEKQDGVALQFASNELKNNERVVTAAAKQDGGRALHYASNELKNNE